MRHEALMAGMALGLAALGLAALAGTAPAAAQAPVRADSSVAAERRLSDSVAVRTPASGALQSYRKDPAFQYERERPPSGASWWDGLRRWLWETLFEPAAGALGAWQRPLVYVLLGAALVFAFVQFARMRTGGGVRPSGRSMAAASFREIEENLQEADLGALVEEAVRTGDHRRAVRLLFLRVLRALAEAGRIDWDPAKTNRAYVRELAAAEGEDHAADELAALTRRFEHVWYGRAALSPETFERLRPRFDRFCRRVEGVGERERA